MAGQAQRDPTGVSAAGAPRGHVSAAGARGALLARLIDHAALFPPASLPMHAALEVDHHARTTPEAWILNRFIVPASKLDAIPEDFEPPLSVVLDTDQLPDLAGRRVELVEARLEKAAALRGAPARVFLEVPPGEADALDAVARAGAGAKVRCGGLTPDAFPSPVALAAFVAGCRDRGLAFKATAGLHHPIRCGIVHGFLNVLAAAVLAHAEGVGEDELAGVLAEEDAGAFELSEAAFVVQGRRVGAPAVAAAREQLFTGYGSCSFSEPVEELQSLGMLPA
jgi:hypothetical protein